MNLQHKKAIIGTIIIIVLSAIIFVLSCIIGRYELTTDIILDIIFGAEKGTAADVFLKIRLPRALVAFIGGGALSLAGLVYQTVFRNPLVSPDVLGVSSGCSIGAIVSILFIASSGFSTALISFAFGIGTVIIAAALAKLIGNKINSSTILAGIVVSALCSSIIMALKYMADPEHQLPVIEYWLMGSLSGVLRSEAVAVAWGVIPAVIILFLLRHKLTIISLGNDEAQTLGINAKLIKAVLIVLATISVAAVTAVAGVIGWIGLIMPHMIKSLCGNNPAYCLVPCFFGGAALLSLADIVCRSMLESEIPISILTSFIGAIFLFFILIRRNLSRRIGNKKTDA